MSVEITDLGDGVRVKYEDDDGNSASALVVGESASSVQDRAQEVVDAHNLEDKAQ